MTQNVGQQTIFSDASDFNSLAFIIARALDKVQTVSIVQVLAVNTSAQTVDVVVLVNLVSGAGQSIPHGRISNRPYFQLQGGSSGIICPPAVDDIGIMVFASRDSSAVESSKAAANPGSSRKFSWSDGQYFGGVLNGAPAQYIEFGSGGVTILSPTAVTINAPSTTVSGDVTLTGAVSNPGGITVGSPTGGAAAPGTINATGLFVNGVAVATGGTPGSGTVTSVGISSTNLTVGGGPITGSGTLTVALTSSQVTDLGLAASALQSVTSSSTYFSGAGTSSSQLTLAAAFITALAATAAEASSALQPVTGLAGSYTSANITLNAAGQITAAASGSSGGGGGLLFGQPDFAVPPSSGWTWQQQGSNTVSSVYSGNALRFLIPGGSSNVEAFYAQSVTPGAFSVTACMMLSGFNIGEYSRAGLYWQDTSTGHMEMFCVDLRSTPTPLASYQFSDLNTYTSTNFSGVTPNYPQQLLGIPIWLRVVRDSSNYITCYFSNDGVEFIPVANADTSNWVANPNAIGIEFENKGGAGAANQMSLILYSFEIAA